MKSEKMKSLSEAKQRYGFPKKFHGNIYNSVFSEKKNQISKILFTWVFVAPKCKKCFKTWQEVWTLTPNKF